MHKRGLAIFLALCAAIACAVPGLSAENLFTDVPRDHWAYDSVTSLAAAGLVEGYPDGSFGGNRIFTRFEMAMIFSRIVDRLEANMQEEVEAKVGSKSAELDRSVAEAAAEARKALAAALEAESKADTAATAASQAQGVADQASGRADAAATTAEEALRQAQAALDATAALQEVANAARDVADQALELARAKESSSGSQATDSAASAAEIEELRKLANEAMAVAQRAESTIEGVQRQSELDLNEYRVAIAEAKEIAERAEELALGAATPAEVAAVQEAAKDAASAADRALGLAESAAQLEDVAAVAAKANEALALAAAADTRARDAQAAIERLQALRDRDSEASEAAMRDYVKQMIIQEMATIKDDTSSLAQRVLALEGKTAQSITAQEAEQIATRVVAERIQAVSGSTDRQQLATQVTQGDVAAVRALVDQKAEALSSDMARLEKEFASELQALSTRISNVEARMAKNDQKVDQLAAAEAVNSALLSKLSSDVEDQGVAVKKFGAELEQSRSSLQDRLARNEQQLQTLGDDVATVKTRTDALDDRVAATRTEVAALTGNVVTTQSDVATAKQELAATQQDLTTTQEGLAAVQSDVSGLGAQVKATEDGLAATRTEVAALTGNVVTTQSDVATAKQAIAATQQDLAAVQSDVSGLGAQAKATEDGLAATRTEVAALTGNVATTQSDVATAKQAIAATQQDLAAVQSDVSGLGAQVKATEDGLAATRTEVAALTGNVVTTQSDVATAKQAIAATQEELAATKQDLAVVKSDVSGMGTQVKATEDGLAATRTEVAALTGNVVTTQSDVATAKQAIAATQEDLAATKQDLAVVKSDVSGMGTQVRATEDGLAATRTEVAALTGNVVTTQSDVAAAKSDLAAVQAELAKTRSELAAAKAELDTIKEGIGGTRQELAALRGDIGSTQSEIADVKQGLRNVKSDLSPMRQLFDATHAAFTADLIYNRPQGSSLYIDPRAAQMSSVERAARAQWYDEREFVKNENFMRFAMTMSTEPAPGMTLVGRVYADKNIQIPGQLGAGVELDLATPGLLRAMHIGELDSANATAGFSKYVLDPVKWDAQLYRVNGIQGAVQLDNGIAVQGFAGHGAIRRVNVAPGTGNDLAGDDSGSLFGIAAQVPLGKLAEARLSWVNMRGTLVSSLNAPMSAYAVGVQGATESLQYSAEVATAGTTSKHTVGDAKITQSLGSVYWAAEYGYRGPDWQQRLAQADVDGLATPGERLFGLEIGGFKPMDFDTKLAHSVVQDEDGDHSVWLLRGERDMHILLPLTLAVEAGSNASSIVGHSLSHMMIDLAVKDYAPFGPNLVLDGGYRYEQTPLQAEEWDLRWRNASVVTPASTLPLQYQNWVADTSRSTSRIKATWYLSPQTGIYAGGRWVNDSPVATAATPAARLAVAGVFSEVTVLGTRLAASYELQNTGETPRKQVVDLSLSRALGQGDMTVHAKLSSGQGTDLKPVGTVDSGMDLRIPVYQSTDLKINAKYVRSVSNDADSYQDARLQAGVAVTF